MAQKKPIRLDGLVYSTNQQFFEDVEPPAATETLPKNEQKLRVLLDKKQRAGKVVTLISGFIGTSDDLEALGKQLKTKCGTGGSVKEEQILIQGDYQTRIITWLKEWGYSLTK